MYPISLHSFCSSRYQLAPDRDICGIRVLREPLPWCPPPPCTEPAPLFGNSWLSWWRQPLFPIKIGQFLPECIVAVSGLAISVFSCQGSGAALENSLMLHQEDGFWDEIGTREDWDMPSYTSDEKFSPRFGRRLIRANWSSFDWHPDPTQCWWTWRRMP